MKATKKTSRFSTGDPSSVRRLDEYNRKRRFDVTPEPAGKPRRTRKKALQFVIQKHRATSLHYDFRLEHGFSPEEVLYGATLSGVSVRDYLMALKEAGVGSLPGTSAEILVDAVRQQVSPGRIATAQWIDLIQTAHEVGIPTTSTIMYGFVESSRDKSVHLDILRQIQRRTGGITEFVPLSFVYEEAPMFHRKPPPGLRRGASGAEVMKMYAVSRLMLNNYIPNLQVSWVKEGPKLSQIALLAGANDFGGTLINESISTAAGASYGQLMSRSTASPLASSSSPTINTDAALNLSARRI